PPRPEARDGPRLRLLPLDGAPPRPAVGHAQRRRAADAGARARARFPPPAADARRAVARSRTHRRAGIVPRRQGAQLRGETDGPRRRAECRDRPRGLASRLRARGRGGCRPGHERRAAPPRGRPQVLPGLLMAEFLQQVVSGLASGAIYASLALALVLIYRSTD